MADVDERIALMIETGARVASFAQAPNPALVARCKEAGLVVIPTVGARRHAEKVAEWGVDAVIAQGAEGGGHTGSRAHDAPAPPGRRRRGRPRAWSSAPAASSAGAGLVAALAYGAAGIAMGTRFLLTAESRVPDAVKELYLGTPVTGTVVTTKVDGAPQRVVRTELVDHLESQSWLRALPRALRSAYRLPPGDRHHRRLAAARGACHEGGQRAHVGPGRHGGQRADDDQGRARRGPHRRGRAAHRSGGGRVESLPTVADIVGDVMGEADAVLRGWCG